MTVVRSSSPKARPVDLDSKTTAVLALDLSESCGDPKKPCHKLVLGMTRFLAKVRDAGVLIAFTISGRLKDDPVGKVYSGFNRMASEPLFFPNGFNKFLKGELQTMLVQRGIKTLVIARYRSNIAVMCTATFAARNLNYSVVIPMDGIVALTNY